jgi:hypothetical protein
MPEDFLMTVPPPIFHFFKNYNQIGGEAAKI